MKHYNKNPMLRAKWIHIKTPRHYMNTIIAKAWCQQQPSDGRFYAGNYYWCFEKEEDVLIFKLRWGYNTA